MLVGDWQCGRKRTLDPPVWYAIGVHLSPMKNSRWHLSAFAICMIACGGSSPPVQVGTPAMTERRTLAQALVQDVGAGASVAIVPGLKGLRAISADGAHQRVLVATPVPWAVVDQRSNLVWFGSAERTEMHAIDLDAPASPTVPVITIATGLPAGHNMEMVGPIIYGVNYIAKTTGDERPGLAWESGEKFASASANNMNAASLFLGIDATPSLVGSAGYVDDESWATQVAAANLPGRAFVIGLLTRTSHRPASVARPSETHIDGIDPANCDEPQDCGRAEVIVGTPYLRVMVANLMGDIRHISWQLYNGASHQLLSPDWATWFSDAYVAPDHSAFIANGRIVRFDRGPLAGTPADTAGSGGGWIGGDAIYDF